MIRLWGERVKLVKGVAMTERQVAVYWGGEWVIAKAWRYYRTIKRIEALLQDSSGNWSWVRCAPSSWKFI